MKNHKLFSYVFFGICLLGLIVSCACLFFFEKHRIGPATFSPDDKFLILSIERQGKEAIYRIRKDGFEVTPITSPEGCDFYPICNCDGSKIAFCSASSNKPGTPAHISIINVDGSGRRQLTFGRSCDLFPVFSNDGLRVYFVRAETYGKYSPTVSSAWHNMDIYSIGVDGTDLKRLTQGGYYRLSPISFSSDGEKILVEISERENSLWLISADKQGEQDPINPNLNKYLPDKVEKPWATEPFKYDKLYEPYFIHSTNNIIFIWAGHYQGYFGQEIYLWDREKDVTRKLTNLKSFITGAFPSYDGSEVVFVKKSQTFLGESELWIVDSDGANARRIYVDFKIKNKRGLKGSHRDGSGNNPRPVPNKMRLK